MSILKVDEDQVLALAARLHEVAGRVGAAGAALGSAGSDGLGSLELTLACGDFAGAWHQGLGRLGEAAGGAGDYLRSAVETLRETDAQLAAGLRQAARPEGGHPR